MNLQENRRRSPNFRQIQLQQSCRFLLPVKHFGIFHGRPMKTDRELIELSKTKSLKALTGHFQRPSKSILTKAKAK